jgi:hypothetical protein
MQQMSSLVTSQLLFLEAEDPDKPINMYINRCVTGLRLGTCWLPRLMGACLYAYRCVQPGRNCQRRTGDL